MALRTRPLVVPLCASLVLVAIPPSPAQPAPEGASGWRDRPPVAARRFLIAAANPLAVDAGYAMLARGGSAVDAAIAVQLVLGLVEPQSSGLGGGGFMLVHDAGPCRLVAYDGRETAPAAAKPDRFLDRDGKPLRFLDAVVGGRSVGVPGTMALLAASHRAHGRLRWADLFVPAIGLADQGFTVSPRLASAIAGAEGPMGNDRARQYFARAGGEPLRAGDTLRNPAYARTLRSLADQGADAFYRGEIARDVVATANAASAHPGDLTLEDLARYRIKLRAPVCGPYRGYRVCGMPLPSSGGPTVLQMLAMLQPYDLGAMGPASFWSTHFIPEAGRLAYADRGAYMADPDFVAPPSGLLDPDYLRERGSLIRATTTLGRATAGVPPSKGTRMLVGQHEGLELASTSHLSIVDARGNAVSFTTTIENGFGSRLMTEGGFLLNNELTDFSFRPVEGDKPVANRVQAGKRPRSSMAPTIVYDARGGVHLVTGSPGGSSIINYVVKTLVATIDWKLDPQAAVALPNFGSRNGPTALERGTPIEALKDKLAPLGHDVQVIELTSGAQAILRTRAGWTAGADPRREGTARGD